MPTGNQYRATTPHPPKISQAGPLPGSDISRYASYRQFFQTECVRLTLLKKFLLCSSYVTNSSFVFRSSWAFSGSPNKCCSSNFKSATSPYLPQPSQFVTHSPLNTGHYTIYTSSIFVGPSSWMLGTFKLATTIFFYYILHLFFTNKQPARSILTYSILTPWCRVLLQKLTGLQLVKIFPAFYGTRRFITALTSARHLSLSWASPIQFTYPHPTSWRSILILSTHLRLGLPSGFFPSGFPTKTLYAPLSSPIRATCPAHLILLDFITRTVLGEEYQYRCRNCPVSNES